MNFEGVKTWNGNKRYLWREEYPHLAKRIITEYCGSYLYGELFFQEEINKLIDEQIRRGEQDAEYKKTLKKQDLLAALQGYAND